MKYTVNYYVKGVNYIKPEQFNSLKEARNEMITFIDEDKAKLLKAGYKRVGSLKSGLIRFEHSIFGVDSQVSLTINKEA